MQGVGVFSVRKTSRYRVRQGDIYRKRSQTTRLSLDDVRRPLICRELSCINGERTDGVVVHFCFVIYSAAVVVGERVVHDGGSQAHWQC